MSAVPEAKAGVGSAMNDLLRQLGGALGVAVIGSVMNTVYRDKVADALTGLPPAAADAAGDSVGAAVAIAAQIGGRGRRGADHGRADAFVDGLGLAAVVAAAVASLTSAYVYRQMPRRVDEAEDRLRHRPPPLRCTGDDRRPPAGDRGSRRRPADRRDGARARVGRATPAPIAAILAATFRQLVEVGYAGLSIESVAAEAGVAKTTLYRRHPTKKELVVAALEAATPFEPPPLDLPTRQALELFVRAGDPRADRLGRVRILGSLLLEESREPGLLDTFRARLLGPRRAMVEAMLQRGIERGELRPDIDPLVVTEMIAGAIFGHHVILGLHGDDAWIDQLVEHVWRAIALDR